MSKRRKKYTPSPYGRKHWQSYGLNEDTEYLYMEWLLQLACARFSWHNLPPEIDPRFLELCINNTGLNVFFYDKEYNKYFACQGAPSGNINMYQNPTHYLAYGANGFNRRLTAAECVPIWNNYLRTPTILALTLYARRLAAIDRTLDVNLAGQKMPVFIKCSQEQRLTIENLCKQWMGNEPIIIGDTLSMEDVDIEYLTAGIPYVGDKILNAKMVIWSEIMSYLGIDNTNIKKAERVQTAEVEANDKQIECSALINLDCRRLACAEINRKYGLDIWVDMNTDFSSVNWAALTMLPAVESGDTDAI